jgi:hypothetical protein
MGMTTTMGMKIVVFDLVAGSLQVGDVLRRDRGNTVGIVVGNVVSVPDMSGVREMHFHLPLFSCRGDRRGSVDQLFCAIREMPCPPA